MAMFNFDPNEDHVRLRNEKGHEFDCLTKKESEKVLKRAWKSQSLARFREQIR